MLELNEKSYVSKIWSGEKGPMEVLVHLHKIERDSELWELAIRYRLIIDARTFDSDDPKEWAFYGRRGEEDEVVKSVEDEVIPSLELQNVRVLDVHGGMDAFIAAAAASGCDWMHMKTQFGQDMGTGELEN